MITAIIGSRAFSDYSLLSLVCRDRKVSSVVSGGARGADTLAERFATSSGLPLKIFLPDYQRFGRRAPLIRNKQIISCAQQIIAFWDGASRGTAHAISIARKIGVSCFVVRV